MQTGKKMVRRIATTSMVPVAQGLLKEEKFTFHRKTQELVTWHKIWKELIINFDQTLLSYITVVNTTLEFSRLQSVPVNGKEKGKQITGTFSITVAGKFMQLIYTGKTQRYHPKGIPFPDRFDVSHSTNHWSNKTLAIQHLDNIFTPYFEVVREELGLHEDQNIFSFMMFSKHKQQTSIVSTLTRATLRMYKYHQV